MVVFSRLRDVDANTIIYEIITLDQICCSPPLVYKKWFSVDVLISLVTGIEPDPFILLFEIYWNCLSLFGWQEKRMKRKERIQVVNEVFQPFSCPAGLQAKLGVPGDRLRSIKFRWRRKTALTSCQKRELLLGSWWFWIWLLLCSRNNSKHKICAEDTFCRIGSLVLKVGRHSPVTAPENPHVNSSELIGLSWVGRVLHGEILKCWILWCY